MNEEGANLSSVMMRVEQVIVPVVPLIGPVKSFALAPAAAGDDDWRSLRFRRTILDNQEGTVRDELSIDSEDGSQRTFHLCGSVVLRLEAADGGINERAEDGKVSSGGRADADVCLHG